MTLIIGIISKEGAVVAADGAATLGSLGNKTVQLPTRKLHILHEKIIVGVSGPVGLEQRITGEIETMWEKGKLKGKKPHEVMVLISQEIRKHILPEIETAKVAQQILGNVALQSAISSTIVALPASHNISLFQFDQQGSPEQVTEDLPFVSIGIGQPIADPFLSFLKRVYWPSGVCQTINDAVFASVWTLIHAIKVSPGGISWPIQVATLKKDSRGEIATFYDDTDLDEHKQAVGAVEQKLSETKLDEIFSEEKAKPIPTPTKNGLKK